MPTYKEKTYNLKLSVNLSIKWHSTEGGTFYHSEKPTLPPLPAAFWYPDSRFSFCFGSILSLCLIQPLLLETALCVPPEFFPSRAQEQGNYHSASNSTSVKEYAVAGGQEEIRKLGVGQITSYSTGKESQIQAHRKIRPKGQHSEHCDGNLPLGQIRNLGVHGLESHLSLALPGQRGDQILGRVCG